MKGVVVAGGLGTRLWPLTKVINKHLLPVGPYPMIYYPIGTLVDAGIRDIMIITGGMHGGMFLELLGSGKEFGLEHLHYAHQDQPGGIADAVRLAENFVAKEQCVVILGDNILAGSIRSYVESFLQQQGGAKILLREVPNPNEFGVAELDGQGRVIRLVEKPKEFISNFVQIGVYLYDDQLWDILPTLQPSWRGQLEITDVNNAYLQRGQLTADVIDFAWGDAGGCADSLFEATLIARDNGLLAQFNLSQG